MPPSTPFHPSVWGNPAERTHRIVATPAELQPPTPAELASLLDRLRVDEPRLHVFVLLAAVSGARRAQLLGLRWRNVDLERGRISFCAGWVEGPTGPVLAETKTKRRHVVDIDTATTATLVDYYERVGGDVVEADRFLFSDDNGITAWKPTA